MPVIRIHNPYRRSKVRAGNPERIERDRRVVAAIRNATGGNYGQEGGIFVKHYHKRRRGSNPFGVGGSEITDAAYGIGGAAAALAIPQVFLSSYNTGMTGVALNVGATALLGFLAKSIKPGLAGPVIVGGLIATGMRAINTFAPGVIPGMSGYIDSPFAVPTSSDIYGRTQTSAYIALPAVQPKSSAPGTASKAAMSGLAYAGRRRY
jgi:hypothetical protein